MESPTQPLESLESPDLVRPPVQPVDGLCSEMAQPVDRVCRQMDGRLELLIHYTDEIAPLYRDGIAGIAYHHMHGIVGIAGIAHHLYGMESPTWPLELPHYYRVGIA